MTTVRTAELSELVTAASRVCAEGLLTLEIAGEPGSGRTTLLAALSGELSRRGWQVCHIEADEVRRRIPYGAVATACRSLALQNSYSDRLRRDAVIALDVLTADHHDDLWFGRAEEAMTRLLTALTTTGPVLLTLAHPHHLDPDSTALLSALTTRLTQQPVALATASPIVRQSRPGVSSLIRQSGPRAELEPLDAGQLSVVLAEHGIAPDEELRGLVEEWADGSPAFAVALSRASRRSPLAVGLGELPPVRLTDPGSLVRRVLPGGADLREVARAAAVLGRIGLDRLELLIRLTGLPGTAAAFDALIALGVLRPDGSAFTHRLVRAALYDELGPAQRRRLHGAIAGYLAGDRHGLRELAWHVAESGVPGDDEAVAILSEVAENVRAVAPREALAAAERAMQLSPDEAPRLHAIRCRALVRLGRPAEAVEAGRRALAGPANAALDRETRRRTVTAVLGSLYSGGRTTEALEVIDAEPYPGAVLRSHRALLLTFTGATDHARREAAHAEHDLATATPADQVVASGRLAMVSTMLADHDRAIRYADRAVDAAGSSRSLRRQALAIGACTTALAGLVDDAASRLALAAADDGQGFDGQGFDGELLTATIVLDWLGGRWDDAITGIDRARSTLDPAQQVLLAGAVRAVELDIRTWRGEVDLAAALTQNPVQAPPNITNLFALSLANYRAERDGPAAALATIRAALGIDPGAAAYGCVLLARTAELGAEPTGLEELVAGRTSPWSRTALHRAAGLVRRDPGLLRQSIEDADGLVFEQARSRLALGLRTSTGTEQLHAAYKTFQALGAHGLRRTAGARLRELGAKVPRASGRQRGLLTESEERIARLVQQGMRNREIAAALHYSPRSVEVYLSRVYAKLGISSRLELARTLDGQLTAIGSARL
jgi:DNA-binding CsgD family transcriptional regulator